MTNSKRKGAVGEREWSSKLNSFGWEARRGQQYNGIEGEDVVSELPFHWEVKRVQRLELTGAVDQAKRDTEWKTPVVAHRKNHCEWLITMQADEFLNLLRFVDLEDYERNKQ